MNRVSLRPKSLNTLVIATVSLLFLSGIALPSGRVVFDPVITEIWDFLFHETMDEYLLGVTGFLGYLGTFAGLVKYYATDSIAEQLKIDGDLGTLGTEDIPIIAIYTTVGALAIYLSPVTLDITTTTQTFIVVVLSLSYVSVPWYLWKNVDLPEQTESPATKTMVLMAVLVLSGTFTTLAVIFLKGVELWF